MGGQPVRLYVKGRVQGYKRSKANQYNHTAIIRIDGVNSTPEAQWYMGKRIVYVYKAKTQKKGTNFRCIWGKATKVHGNTGAVRAKFNHNLPTSAIGGVVRMMLYPSAI